MHGVRLPFALVFLTLFLAPLSADFFADDAGTFAFDLPEGFVVTASKDDAWTFKNAVLPVELAVRAYSERELAGMNAAASRKSLGAMENVRAKLGAEGDTNDFVWRGQTCAISRITMRPQGYEQTQAGWALAAPLPETNGAVVAVVFAPEQYAARLDRFMLSALDSLYIDQESWFASGAVTTFAYPESPKKEIRLNIEGRSVTTHIGTEDAEAARFVIEREYSVLTMYAGTQFVTEAWQRYYRQIYRDSCERLKTAAGDIAAAFGGMTSESLLRTLLGWTQKFPYARDFSASDFAPLPSVLEGAGSDCDSRSMLLSVILNAAGCNAIFLFSPEYKHALLGMEIPLEGAKIDAAGKRYLLGETTANVAPGIIAAEMGDGSKWVPVIFPR
jgi:hypothetical protein